MRSTCKTACDALNEVLPKPDGGLEYIFPVRTQARISWILRRKVDAQTLRAHDFLLTDAQLRIFELYYYEGISQLEIARRLGIRENSVSESLRASRHRIGRYLKTAKPTPEPEVWDGIEEGEGSAPFDKLRDAETPTPHLSASQPAPNLDDTATNSPLHILPIHPETTPPPRLVGRTRRGHPHPSDSLQSLPPSADDGSGEESAIPA